jgi:hypothetical protein
MAYFLHKLSVLLGFGSVNAFSLALQEKPRETNRCSARPTRLKFWSAPNPAHAF